MAIYKYSDAAKKAQTSRHCNDRQNKSIKLNTCLKHESIMGGQRYVRWVYPGPT